MKTCNNMNIILQTTVGDTSSINDKSGILNKTLAHIIRAVILNLSNNKELW